MTKIPGAALPSAALVGDDIAHLACRCTGSCERYNQRIVVAHHHISPVAHINGTISTQRIEALLTFFVRQASQALQLALCPRLRDGFRRAEMRVCCCPLEGDEFGPEFNDDIITFAQHNWCSPASKIVML